MFKRGLSGNRLPICLEGKKRKADGPTLTVKTGFRVKKGKGVPINNKGGNKKGKSAASLSCQPQVGCENEDEKKKP